MTERRLVSVDIGSTWTKAALFLLCGGTLRTAARTAVPTTPADLAVGFSAAVAPLADAPPDTVLEELPRTVPWVFSSSAKGGLRIAAVGLTRDLTLRAARLTAMSAGGRVVASFAYRLAAEDAEHLAALRPDIILLSGGTDGGNERTPLENARVLARLRLPSVVLFAGNRSVAGQVQSILSGLEVHRSENLMPEIGVFRPEPAREAIRRIFLERIVLGKGLDRIRRRAAAEPRPTPLAVFELVRVISGLEPEWSDFCVVDMGGATTDVYSVSAAQPGERVRVQGLPEPRLKRSVEGDLGLRLNAVSLAREAETLPGFSVSADIAAARCFAAEAAAQPGRLSRSKEETRSERCLACACMALALTRHAGRLREVWTSDGITWLLQGKDLRRVTTVIGTGGYLARSDAAIYEDARRLAPGEDEGLVLLPADARYRIDRPYLWPLIGNLATLCPGAAARLAVDCLEESVQPARSAE